MPYCPKCDMEFVDGITTCTDCGGPLVGSKEEAEAMKKEAMEEARKKAAEMEMPVWEGEESETLSSGMEDLKKRRAALSKRNQYVNKAQKYQDTKASASAFLFIGAILTAGSVLLWSGVIQLPLMGTSRFLTFGVLTAMGLGSLAVGAASIRSAKSLSKQAEEEESRTASILEGFQKDHTADSLDARLGTELDGLSPEEASLKRLDLIQDILVTTYDIPDQAYADSLADQLYEKIFHS